MIVQNDSNPLMSVRSHAYYKASIALASSHDGEEKKLNNKKNGEQIFTIGRYSVIHHVLIIP